VDHRPRRPSGDAAALLFWLAANCFRARRVVPLHRPGGAFSSGFFPRTLLFAPLLLLLRWLLLTARPLALRRRSLRSAAPMAGAGGFTPHAAGRVRHDNIGTISDRRGPRGSGRRLSRLAPARPAFTGRANGGYFPASHAPSALARVAVATVIGSASRESAAGPSPHRPFFGGIWYLASVFSADGRDLFFPASPLLSHRRARARRRSRWRRRTLPRCAGRVARAWCAAAHIGDPAGGSRRRHSRQALASARPELGPRRAGRRALTRWPEALVPLAWRGPAPRASANPS